MLELKLPQLYIIYTVKETKPCFFLMLKATVYYSERLWTDTSKSKRFIDRVQILNSRLPVELYRQHLIFPETVCDNMYGVMTHQESSPKPWCPVFLLSWGLSCGHGELMRLILMSSDSSPFRRQTDLVQPKTLTINHTVSIKPLVVYLVDLHIYKTFLSGKIF